MRKEKKEGIALCRIFYFVSVTPVGLQQPFSIQRRGVVGSVKMERAKVKLFALEQIISWFPLASSATLRKLHQFSRSGKWE